MSELNSTDDVQKVLQVKQIIEKDYKYHYTHEQLALRVNTNESKLRQRFKQVVCMTIYEYLTRVRIERAKELLEETDLPIKMVADRVGYDVRSFNRQFKKVTEVAPLVWRRRARSCKLSEQSLVSTSHIKTDLTIS